jgi:hypothetical protein
MVPRKGKPYVWVTWITGLLAGVDRCAWRAWIKSHYYYDKSPDTGDNEQLKTWIKTHDAMTANRVNRLKSEGYAVLVEEEGAFKLEGTHATLGGKPDIVAVKEDDQYAVVIDEKSGKVKTQYIWQVKLYIFAMGLTRFQNWRIRGEVEYKDSVVPVNEIIKPDIDQISSVMKVVGGDKEPPRVPSEYECEYCDILRCPDRWKATTDATKYF